MAENFTETAPQDYFDQVEEEDLLATRQIGRDYYAVLNVDRQSSTDAIRSQYKKLSMMLHPDRHQNNKDAADRNFQLIQEAYEVLSDPERRLLYDRYGADASQLVGQWQVAGRQRTLEELEALYEKHRYTEKLKEAVQVASSFQGQVEMTFDAKSLLDQSYRESVSRYDDDFSFVPEMSRLLVQQSTGFAASEQDQVTLSGVIVSQPGRQGLGFLRGSWRRSLAYSKYVEGQVSLGSVSFVGLAFGGQVGDPKKPFVLNCQLTQNSLSLPPSFEITASRGLPGDLIASLKYKTGDWFLFELPNDSIGLQIAKQGSKLKWSMEFSIGAVEPACVESKFTRKLTKQLSISVSGNITLQQQSITLGFKRQFWDQFHSINVGLQVQLAGPSIIKLKLQRYNQSFVVPVVITDDLNLQAIGLAIGIPLLLGSAVNQFVFEPQQRRLKRMQQEEQRKQLQESVNQQQKQQKDTVELLRPQYEQRHDELVISSALYGVYPKRSEEMYVDVTVPLQMLVQNNKLTMGPSDRSQLLGFFNPSPWLHKDKRALWVQYTYKNNTLAGCYKDDQSIVLPKFQAGSN